MFISWIDGKFKIGLVSVIIPTHNRSGLLSEAIESIIHQTYRPIECIVIDDGSVDNTKAIVDKINAVKHEHFSLQYLFQNKSGAPIARNKGTSMSQGEFIQYLDSDDLLYHDKLKVQVEYLNNSEDCDGVFGDWQVGSIDNKETIIAHKNDDFVAQLLTAQCISNFSFLMRRRIVEKIGAWDVNIKRNQEIDFHLRGILAHGNFHYQSVLCGLWRTHPNERIANTTGLSDILFFYKKSEILLKQKSLFSPQLANKIADTLMWLVSQNKNSDEKQLVNILKEAIRLNPEIEFNKSIKLKLIKSFLGSDLALKIWLTQFRRSTKV